jgi:hypothetical protein
MQFDVFSSAPQDIRTIVTKIVDSGLNSPISINLNFSAIYPPSGVQKKSYWTMTVPVVPGTVFENYFNILKTGGFSSSKSIRRTAKIQVISLRDATIEEIKQALG